MHVRCWTLIKIARYSLGLKIKFTYAERKYKIDAVMLSSPFYQRSFFVLWFVKLKWQTTKKTCTLTGLQTKGSSEVTDRDIELINYEISLITKKSQREYFHCQKCHSRNRSKEELKIITNLLPFSHLYVYPHVLTYVGPHFSFIHPFRKKSDTCGFYFMWNVQNKCLFYKPHCLNSKSHWKTI